MLYPIVSGYNLAYRMVTAALEASSVAAVGITIVAGWLRPLVTYRPTASGTDQVAFHLEMDLTAMVWDMVVVATLGLGKWECRTTARQLFASKLCVTNRVIASGQTGPVFPIRK